MMKRSLGVSLLTIIGLLSLTARAGAAPIGPPGATVGAGQVGLAGEFDFVIDRDLDGVGEEADSIRLMAKGSVGLSDRVGLDFRLGTGDIEIEDVFKAELKPTTIDGEFGLVYGAGVRVTWIELKDPKIKIGSVFQFLTLHTDADTSPIVDPLLARLRTDWTEFDLALGSSVEIMRAFLPYVGFVWSTVDADAVARPSVDERTLGFKEEDVFGLFFGLEVRPTEVALGERKLQTLRIGTEIRVIDATEWSFWIGYAF